jgi:hypothetical protein
MGGDILIIKLNEIQASLIKNVLDEHTSWNDHALIIVNKLNGKLNKIHKKRLKKGKGKLIKIR